MTRFCTLTGQESAIGALQQAFRSSALPGSLLFTGAAGSGKAALALAAAQTAACHRPLQQQNLFDACGQCPSCLLAQENKHPEIVSIFPAGEQLQIWQLWDRDNHPPGVLSRSLNFAPVLGKKRVFIIHEAERLTEGAANSLLKVLEEPPDYALFILLAVHSARILSTLVSRCCHIRLQPVAAAAIQNLLQSRFNLPSEQAALLAACSEGRIGQAVRMAATPEIGSEMEKILDFACSLPQAQRASSLRIAEQLRKLGAQTIALAGQEPAEATGDADTAPRERAARRQLAALFEMLMTFYRDLLALSLCREQAVLIHRDRAAMLQFLASCGSPERWSECLNSLMLARRRLDANAAVNLLTESLAMSLLRPEAS